MLKLSELLGSCDIKVSMIRVIVLDLYIRGYSNISDYSLSMSSKAPDAAAM